MTSDLTSYRPIGNLTDWLVRISIITIILYIIELASEFFVTLSGTIDNSTYTISDSIGTFIFIITIMVIVMVLWWFHRATTNINSFGAKYVNSPGMAVVWWFVPVMNLWKPHEVAQQIWRASSPEIKLAEGTEWRKVSTSNIIKLWWILGLVSIFGTIIFGNISSGIISQYNIIDPEQLQESLLMSIIVSLARIPLLVICVISIIFFMRMIRQISKWQDLKINSIKQ